MPITEYP